MMSCLALVFWDVASIILMTMGYVGAFAWLRRTSFYKKHSFEAGATFRSSIFGANANFREATFGAEASFLQTRFRAPVHFTSAKFVEGKALFYNARYRTGELIRTYSSLPYGAQSIDSD